MHEAYYKQTFATVNGGYKLQFSIWLGIKMRYWV